jgi:hypothetical protein
LIAAAGERSVFLLDDRFVAGRHVTDRQMSL